MVNTAPRTFQFDRKSFRPGLELDRGLLEPFHVGAQTGRPLDEGGVCGAGFSRTTAEVFGRLSRLKQATLGCVSSSSVRRCSCSRRTMEAWASSWRRSRLVALLLGLVTFSLRAARSSAQRESRPPTHLQLGIKADDRLLVAVVIVLSNAIAFEASAMTPSSPAVSSARRKQPSRLQQCGVRSDPLISRLVSRMPRVSCGMPPLTRRGRGRCRQPWFATGSVTCALASQRRRRLCDPGVTDGLANRAGISAVGRGTTEVSATQSLDIATERFLLIDTVGAMSSASLPPAIRNPHRPACCSRTSWKPAVGVDAAARR